VDPCPLRHRRRGPLGGSEAGRRCAATKGSVLHDITRCKSGAGENFCAGLAGAEWKQRARPSPEVPGSVTFVPADLLADSLGDGLRDAAGDSYAEQVGQASAERGEPWLSLFTPDAMAALLARCGFGPARDVGQREMIPAGLWDRPDCLRPAELSHIAHAVVAAADHAGLGGR
jgi:O-methyltransferase involved in polyketide biosynthesis